MITQTIIRFKNDTPLDHNMSSLMQGLIMEKVSPSFADKEHISAIRSYSQYLIKQDETWSWIINTLTDEAKENITDKFSSQDILFLKSKNIHIAIEDIIFKNTSFNELFENNYYLEKRLPPYVNLTFITPTAFKSGGVYINYPTERLLLASMINKYNALSDVTKLGDDDLAEKISESVRISNYNLRSTYFHLEGVRIPAFLGQVTLKIRGGTNMISSVHMLTEFAQYSGIGIKSAIGMGAVKKR